MYKKRAEPEGSAQPLEVTPLGQHRCRIQRIFLILRVRAVSLFPADRISAVTLLDPQEITVTETGRTHPESMPSSSY